MILPQHRDLALKLLVARSLPGGLPWTVEEDQGWIIRERLLWLQLTPEEQQAEQAFLTDLWQAKNAKRALLPNPEWGPWAAALPTVVSIPDAAFGLPESAYRPYERGISQLLQDHPGDAGFLQWLWDRGYHPVEMTPDTLILLLVNPMRATQEADRLVGLLVKTWPGLPVGALELRASYDPVSGRAVLVLSRSLLLAVRAGLPTTAPTQNTPHP